MILKRINLPLTKGRLPLASQVRPRRSVRCLRGVLVLSLKGAYADR
jgi:hypothetical protein